MTETLEAQETYTFAQLSEPAKDKARDAKRYAEYYLAYGWWDSVYEDAARIATILGIDLMRMQRRNGVAQGEAPDINFSGFSSQGDGACFRGSYRFNPNAVNEINAYCNDKKLVSLATSLFALQLTRRLLGLEPFSATISTSMSGKYSHSNTMFVDVSSEDENGEHSYVGEDLEQTVTQLMRSFADWIYSSLEAEHDYQMSDEVVDEQLADETFDEDGNEV